MIDIAAVLIFSSLVVYTAVRAIKLDKMLPWFSDAEPKDVMSSKKGVRK